MIDPVTFQGHCGPLGKVSLSQILFLVIAKGEMYVVKILATWTVNELFPNIDKTIEALITYNLTYKNLLLISRS